MWLLLQEKNYMWLLGSLIIGCCLVGFRQEGTAHCSFLVYITYMVYITAPSLY